jgi:ubiquinone/menaquinone biosynthesis C-methylase UbiE
VTSVDIFEQQLNIARSRAAALGLQVDFVRADVVDVSSLRDKTCDVVDTGGHVAVWMSDVRCYYREGNLLPCW